MHHRFSLTPPGDDEDKTPNSSITQIFEAFKKGLGIENCSKLIKTIDEVESILLGEENSLFIRENEEDEIEI